MIIMRLSKNSSLLLFYLLCTCLHCRKKKHTENSSTLRLSMLVVFCFNEWGIEEFAISSNLLSSGYKLKLTLLILV
jgi:hypothetical protein